MIETQIEPRRLVKFEPRAAEQRRFFREASNLYLVQE